MPDGNPPGVKFTFLDYVGLALILPGGEELLRRPREGWQIWIPGLVLGCVALAFRDRSPRLVAWFLAWFRAPNKLAAALTENAGLKKQLAELTGTVGTAKTSKLVIHSANYATWSGHGKRYDVTRFLRHIISGDSLVFGPIDNGRFWIGDENLVPNDPLEGEPKRLEVTYSYDGEQSKTVRRAEHSRLTLPEDSVVDWLGSELNNAKAEIDRLKAAQPKPSQYPIPNIRLKILSTVSELQGFLGAHGDEPRPPDLLKKPGETDDAFLLRLRARDEEPMWKWRAKFLGDYRLGFKDKVSGLRDEMRSRAHIDDSRLNIAIDRAENERNDCVTSVQGVIERFWELALKVNV